jgi:hypothetical protein
LSSPTLIADGNRARIDGFVRVADPLMGLAIALVILKIT